MLRVAFPFAAALLILSPVRGADLPPAVARRVEFDRDVRPLLVAHCFACHGPDKQRGGLRLDRKADALRGGDSGVVIVAGKGADSPLVRLTAGRDSDRIMPPKGPRLTAQQVGILRAWVDQGADWPATAEADDPLAWWSLQPLRQPTVPLTAFPNPIDAFVRATLREKGLTPSPEADRRTLIRRLTFDLIGLPPTPEEVEAFTADRSPDAYEKVVDRLLASPHYGERWARHWLDIVHYGDTHGYDKDQPRPNAWPYRDYVIRSLNADTPYARFVQEQVAGDVMFPGTADGVTAMGFLAAGPWDQIGHAEVPETKLDGKVARHLDRDDVVATTINTFASLTVQCAQCHNHKFDPIAQVDYYRLQAVFAALDRADRPYHANPAAAKRYGELTAAREALRKRQQALDAKVKELGGRELVDLDERIAVASKPGSPRPEFGYHSHIEPTPDRVKWVQVDLGAAVPLDRVVVWPCHDDFAGIGAGFGFPIRYRVEASDDPTFRAGVTRIADRTAADVPNPGVAPQTFPADGIRRRYLRVTATRLAPRQNDFIFALAELEAFDAAGTNHAAKATVTALDSIEAPVRWRATNFTDGHAAGRHGPTDGANLRADRAALLARVTPSDVAAARTAAATEAQAIETELATVKPVGLVYAGTIHHGTGAFRGTGPDGGRPRPIFVLKRGEVQSPGQEVGPGTLAVVRELPAVFDLPPGHPEGQRRAALARWLTDPRNPLPWRSIVNRVWQYHFGRGIVATPSDFGQMGQLPSHPALLDWLAADFRDNGQSLKKLHRRIVTSATYRQSSAGDPRAEAWDADNVYLWRMSRRKLEAEAVRDAALMVAGRLDRTMYGPPFRDFVIQHPEHSPHYQYHLADPDDPATHRRSVYRFLVRSRPQPFMTVLDCADPSLQVAKRTESLSPLQALALFNNGFMLTMAKHLAERVAKEPDPVSAAVRLALGRLPTEAERVTLTGYAKEHGLANACRVILNLNEFVFVD